jgi:hypothetical protein
MFPSGSDPSKGSRPARFLLKASVSDAWDEPDSFNLNRGPQEWGNPDQGGYDLRLSAARWHQLFAGIPGDARANLAWDGLFSAVVPVAHNFYSSGEEVFDEHPHTTHPVAWQVGMVSGRFAWPIQEKLKGRTN